MIKKDDYDLYFLNDLYDDELVTDSISTYMNRLYHNISKGKESIQHNSIRNGYIREICVDNTLNYKYNMPNGSYSLRLKCNIVPFYSEKVFLNNYEYDSAIDSSVIMEDSHVFNKILYFFIGDYYFYDVKVVIQKHGCIIFIPVSDNEGDFCKKHLDELINNMQDDTWTIMLSTKSDFYYGYQQKASLISDNRIYVSKFSTNKIYKKPNKNNCWTMYITCNGLSKNVMLSTNVVLKVDDTNKAYFEISDEFKEYAKGITTAMKCIIINEPECTGNGIYVNAETTDPIFQIPFKKNPIPLGNFIIWKYDAIKDVKLHPLEASATIIYPNIYNFSNMLTDEYRNKLFTDSQNIVNSNCLKDIIILNPDNSKYDLYIEWIEPLEDISAYDSYIQDYIDCYGSAYAQMLNNGTVHPLIKEYEPIKVDNDTSEDYLTSPFKGDYRAWKLDKLVTLLKDNPIRYDELYQRLYEKQKRFYSRTFTYEKEYYIYDRSIMSTAEHCDPTATDLIYTFSEPHCFIHIYNASCEEKPCSLFIDGIRKKITHIMNYGSTLFVYFPTRYIESNEDITLEVEIDSEKQELNHYYMDKRRNEIDLEERPFKRFYSLSDLIFYDGDTGEYIDTEGLKFTLQIKIAQIKYKYMDFIDTISLQDMDNILYENELLLVVPTDADYIVLDASEYFHNITNINSHKKINLNDIVIELDNSKFYNKKFTIANTNFVKEININIDENTLANDNLTVTFTRFKGKPLKSRFRLFANGRLINPSLYDMVFSTFNGEVSIKFVNAIPKGNLSIEYIGYDEEKVFDAKISELKDTSNSEGILYLDKIVYPYNYRNYTIYIDGYRVSEEYINIVSQGSMLSLARLPFTISDDSNIVIMRQVTDPDPYDYVNSNHFLDTVSKDDNIFSQYLIKKYH